VLRGATVAADARAPYTTAVAKRETARPRVLTGGLGAYLRGAPLAKDSKDPGLSFLTMHTRISCGPGPCAQLWPTRTALPFTLKIVTDTSPPMRKIVHALHQCTGCTIIIYAYGQAL
jgi:hypothetical protein